MGNWFVSLALATAALSLVACGSSPTEPTVRQTLTLHVDTLSSASHPGGLSVFNDACGCAVTPIIMTVNGQDLGSASDCGMSTTLPMSATTPSFTISARSKDAAGNPITSGSLTGEVTLAGGVSALSLSLRVGCSAH